MALNTSISDQSPAPALPVDVVPSATWQMLAHRSPTSPLPQDFDALFDAARGYLFRLKHSTARYLRMADQVLAYDKVYAALTEPALREAALEFRAKFRTGKETAEDVVRAAALVREVAARQRAEKHYRVQVAGALALYHGCVAEMATGEGKTLTATIPAVLAGWRGKGCHIITVNDYLAQRDANLMRPIYEFCGLTVDSLNGESEPAQRRHAYHCDITYCTNKEVCADFLRDRLALGHMRNLPSAILAKVLYGQGTDRLVQRGLAFAIIDEADSILIDEAVTPLIISGDAPNEEQIEAFQEAAKIASMLMPQKHFKVNVRFREIELTDEGFSQVMEAAEPLGGIWHGARRAEELVTQALTAREFYRLGKQYVVAADEESGDPKVVIVDEFTGRLMPDRTWREGLHQAIEAKESLKVNPPKDTFARISFQRFFRSYKKLCGMTGTAREATRELWQIYHLPVVVIPTNKPCIRRQLDDQIFASEDAKWVAITRQIVALHEKDQPILVGTRSVGNSERLSEMLAGLPTALTHQVLNAVRHKEEAQIVAGAGSLRRITVATNMAGRGTDIKLARGVTDLGGLFVLATERHESRRVDRQLFGRAARQGDPGSAVAMVSLEDELVARYTPRMARLLRKFAGNTKAPLTGMVAKLAGRVILRAQKRAQRIALQQRRSVLRSDDWLDESLGFAGSE